MNSDTERPRGWYGPLIIAWDGKFPTPGDRCVVKNKAPGTEGCPNPVLYIVREATQEEWLASLAERGRVQQPRPGQRYFEVQVD